MDDRAERNLGRDLRLLLVEEAINRRVQRRRTLEKAQLQATILPERKVQYGHKPEGGMKNECFHEETDAIFE